MTPTDRPAISIIIPTLNEGANLRACLSTIPHRDDLEVLICDGGSADNTLKIAATFPAKIITSTADRASQMNAAASCARGDILLFLHADTRLPNNATTDIASAIQEGFSMGCFERQFDSDSKLLAMTSRWAGWRVKKTFLAYGDQAIFLKRNLFESLGGYRPLRRFEDLDLATRAKAHGRWIVLPEPIITDARRFGKHPLLRVLNDAILTLAWLLGIIDQ